MDNNQNTKENINYLNEQLKRNETKLDSIYEEIGKHFYETNKDAIDVNYMPHIKNINAGIVRIQEIDQTVSEMKEEIICPKCGSKNVKGSVFCAECGTSLKNIGAAKTINCTGCGEKNNAGNKYCIKCGNKLITFDNK